MAEAMSEDKNVETVTLGPGCFWSFDAVARRTPGITSSVAGYAGDNGPPPDYEGYVRHGLNPQKFVEAVRLTFRPEEISFEEVLIFFFRSHDPTTPNQSGADHGSIYHSTIFYADEEQRVRSEKVMDSVRRQLGRDIVTDLRPYGQFFEAESDQQDFYNKHRVEPYCRAVIEPKLRTLGLDVD
ncbi:peptide-methionine (S)-S-oxide reductase MsrA [Embleya scabrispora]|jgi:peptide-methionine (S)-S-oxide reductase|uniref:peptide-methionine (S)-S-oxide reductase MsrA n=1 Tax=Embleya scabrispora TaxID=159449 RepID=UPI0003AA831D|nr:peptide-methionine (S)-S-oxide reductase MsrA [Embleya scabrispora]MYS86099.1 peptide-methionine (S)-S-oxide reductase MsrA [Streptomyces sp. SID5474]